MDASTAVVVGSAALTAAMVGYTGMRYGQKAVVNGAVNSLPLLAATATGQLLFASDQPRSRMDNARLAACVPLAFGISVSFGDK
jgi:hypothetical protein